MKEKDFSFKHLGIGLLTILFYFLFSNFVILLLISTKTNKTSLPLALYYLLTYSTTLIVLLLIYRKHIIKDFNKFKKNYKKYLSIAFSYWLKGFFIMMVSNYILNIILKLGQSTNELDNIALLKSNIIIHTLTVVIIAPFLEELVFRLSFNKMTKNKHIFSYITGIIFGSIHIVTSLSLKNPLNILLLIPYSAMGVALGYAYKETDNIFSSLTMHMLHNLFSIIIIIISIKGGLM